MAFWLLWSIDAAVAFGVLCCTVYGLSDALPQQPGALNLFVPVFCALAALAAVVFGSPLLRRRGYRWIASAAVAVPTALGIVAVVFVLYLLMSAPRH